MLWKIKIKKREDIDVPRRRRRRRKKLYCPTTGIFARLQMHNELSPKDAQMLERKPKQKDAARTSHLFLWKCWRTRQASCSDAERKFAARGLKKRVASQNPPRRGGNVPPVVTALKQKKEEKNDVLKWARQRPPHGCRRTTLIGQVSSAEFNLFAYSVTDGQFYSIYTDSLLYSSYSTCFHWFIYKTVLCTGLLLQCNVTFFQQTRYKKVI